MDVVLRGMAPCWARQCLVNGWTPSSQSDFPRISLSMVSGKGVLQVCPHLDSRRGLGVTVNMCSYGLMAVEGKV